MSAITNRFDFLYLFDCQDGNPNGDPDMDNSPRADPETFQGLVSDVCLKRKIRDYVHEVAEAKRVAGQDAAGYDIFVRGGQSLESQQQKPYQSLQLASKEKGSKPASASIEAARDWMCKHFFDVRAFGAVMSTTDFNCGQVRGPVQLTFARSFDRVFTTEHTITRQAHTTEKDQASKQGGTMGRKHTVAYGLYRAFGFVNPSFAKSTGFGDADLALLWDALANMFDRDRSAARGLMAARGLVVFQHDSVLGNAPAHQLFESVTVALRQPGTNPRSFADYEVRLPDAAALPRGVKLLHPLVRTAQA